MKTPIVLGLFAVLGFTHTTTGTSAAVPQVGALAPRFALTDDRGVNRQLADYRGRFVVLEWHSNECPYVAKHYGSGSMQQRQREWTSRGVVWLVIESAGPGQPGHVTATGSQAYMAAQQASPTAVLLDPTGEVGYAYGAKTALHMAVINPAGQLIYLGGIDDRPTTDPADLRGARNYVSQALEEALDGRAVSVPTARPYGCMIFYAPQEGLLSEVHRNGAARFSSSSRPGSWRLRGLPGWMTETWQLSAASTSCA